MCRGQAFCDWCPEAGRGVNRQGSEKKIEKQVTRNGYCSFSVFLQGSRCGGRALDRGGAERTYEEGRVKVEGYVL